MSKFSYFLKVYRMLNLVRMKCAKLCRYIINFIYFINGLWERERMEFKSRMALNCNILKEMLFIIKSDFEMKLRICDQIVPYCFTEF